MTIQYFDRRLLEFIYHLTKEQRYMNSIEISKYLKQKGVNVSDRTVRRWFTRLEKAGFQYFPFPKYDVLGLQWVIVLVYGVKDESIFDIIPYDMYISKGAGFSDHNLEYICSYVIPQDSYNKFVKFWEFAKQKKLIKDFKILKINRATFLFSPFHKIVKDGIIKFDSQFKLDNCFLNLLKEEKKFNNDIHPLIKKNPIVLPILLEYYRRHVSSYDVWNMIKQKLGDSVWDSYLKKYRRKASDGKGQYIVQRFLSIIRDNQDFIEQVRVIYDPFYKVHNVLLLYIVVQLKKDMLEDFIKQIAKMSVHLNIYHSENDTYMIYSVTSVQMLYPILKLANEYSKAKPILFINDFEASKKFWTEERFSLDYAKLFDPINVKWKYNHKEYINKLRRLSKI
ncbi:MAG: hypothetical protein J7K22_03015 [Nanoarchaeota archaeon]|nr:hypothetical protein [Nanoarchaeota archaeon]